MPTTDPTIEQEAQTGGADPQGELNQANALLTEGNVSFPSGTAVPTAPANGAGTAQNGATPATTAAPAAPAATPTTPAGPGTGPVGTPTYAPPPPPPPAPAPPGGAPRASTDVADFAQQWMETPNRYLSELATKTREAGDLRRTAAREKAGVGIEEWAAKRGLLGSSYEGQQRAGLEGQLAAAQG